MNTDKKENSPVALITGAAGIVGPGICSVLDREGWRVAAADLSEENFDRCERGLGKPIACDARFFADLSTGREDCFRLVEQVEETLGEIGLLVNGAVLNENTLSFDSVPEGVVEAMVRLDLLAPFYLTQAALPSLKNTRGSVVNISSVMTRKLFKRNFLYAAFKSGLEKMTEALALELADEGVRVNAIRLGRVPPWGRLEEAARHLNGEQRERLWRDALGRKEDGAVDNEAVMYDGTPEDVGEVIAFLASARARYLHGAVIPLDGAWWCRPGPPRAAREPQEKPWYNWLREWLQREDVLPPPGGGGSKGSKS